MDAIKAYKEPSIEYNRHVLLQHMRCAPVTVKKRFEMSVFGLTNSIPVQRYTQIARLSYNVSASPHTYEYIYVRESSVHGIIIISKTRSSR